ncbi:DUF4369 domain-containing protein [Marinilabiliaceae bacterium JC017]|nr:DUF4369 domain-containing protein [Marinilabiliaceae bacterium JC017]
MRNLIIAAAMVISVSACQTETKDGFKLSGKINGGEGKSLVLGKINGRSIEGLDTAKVINGKVEFSGTLKYPQYLVIAIEGGRPAMQFYGENSQMTINGHIDSLYNAKVTGSATNDLMETFKNEQAKFNEKEKELYQQYEAAQQAKDQEASDAVLAKYQSMSKERQDQTSSFIAQNTTSPVALSLIQAFFMNEEYTTLNEQFTKLDTALAVIPAYNAIKDRLVILEKVQEGKEAPDFTLTSIDGKEVSLSSFRGKYLLVDFWASWCGPCRAENPNVKNAYMKFHKKGFEVLSVSVDRDQNAWKKAVEEDDMTWTQLNDTKKVAGQLYGVTGIPHTILIDQDGIILAKNLRGKDIHSKLEELLN